MRVGRRPRASTKNGELGMELATSIAAVALAILWGLLAVAGAIDRLADRLKRIDVKLADVNIRTVYDIYRE